MSKKAQAMTFQSAIRSYLGYLEGTQKSAHTIKNYRLDIAAFQNFILKERDQNQVPLDHLGQSDIEHYRHFLLARGFKNNTRRRKILTVSQFLKFLSNRKKIAPEFSKKIPAPHKIERIPYTVSSSELIEKVLTLPVLSALDLRNRTLLLTLAETGCLVSEIADLKFEHWYESGPEHWVSLGKKEKRKVPVSSELYESVQRLKAISKHSQYLFQGFNRFGPLGTPLTSRGVEILVKQYGPKLGFEGLVPRTFRHSIILKWFSEGRPQSEIQNRLGLKTTYAFRSYESLLKTRSKTTS